MLGRHVAVALAGVVPGFFLVGPAVFADGEFPERMKVLGLIAAVYVLVGAIAGLATRSWASGLTLSAGGVVTASLVAEAPRLAVVVIGLVLLSACAGALGGSLLGRRRA